MKNLRNNFINRFVVRFLYRKNVKKLSNKQLNKSFIDLKNVLFAKKESEYPLWQIKIAFECTKKEMKGRKLL